MSTVQSLPTPHVIRTVEQALGAARNETLTNIVIISEMENGFLIINAGDGEPLTGAQVVWMLLKAQTIIMGPDANLIDRK